MNIPLLDLTAHTAALRAELLAALTRVVDSNQFINGPQVRELEEAVARLSGCAHGIGVASGTDALLCALMALGVGSLDPSRRTGDGADEVITTPYTFFATAGSIWRAGARPVFVDIDPATYNLDPARLEAAITPRTRAILPVHLFGQVADMDPILAVAERHGLPVIEDACQAIGATYRGRPAGAFGIAGGFSFFPSKNLGGLGDGGLIVTRDAAFAEKLAAFRNHGSKVRYHHIWVGGNFRLDTLQAAALLVKLPHLAAWSQARRANARRYDAALAGIPEIVPPRIHPACESIYNQYVIRAPRRDALRAHLQKRGIGTEVYYPVCLHEQECFRSLGHARGDFPESERAAAETLALPIHPDLPADHLDRVAAAIREFYQ